MLFRSTTVQTNGVIKNCLIELDIHAKSTIDAMLNSLDYHTKTKVKNLRAGETNGLYQ